MKLFLEGNDEDMGRHENNQTSNFSFLFFSFQNHLFGAYIEKISTFIFGCMVIPLNPIWSTPSEKPKRFGI
jgi:hypothetical protein